jgi:hypothetical protein
MASFNCNSPFRSRPSSDSAACASFSSRQKPKKPLLPLSVCSVRKTLESSD